MLQIVPLCSNFVIKKVKSTVPWTYVVSNLNGEDMIGSFDEKELQETNKKGLRVEKVIKKNGNKLHVNAKAEMIILTVGLIKET